MKLLRFQRAFSIVELAIVIAVIGILAATILVAYPLVQNNAKDAKIREGAVKIADSTEQWTIRTGRTQSTIAFGYLSTGMTLTGGNGLMLCEGTPGFKDSWVSSGQHPCTLEDVLVESGILPNGYIESLPINAYTKNQGEQYRLAACPGDSKHIALLYTLYSPTASDDDNYQQIATKCSLSGYEKIYRGMRGARLIEIDSV